MRCGNANLVTSPPSVSSACLASNAVPSLRQCAKRRRSSEKSCSQKMHSAVSRVERVMRMDAALNASATDADLAAVSGKLLYELDTFSK